MENKKYIYSLKNELHQYSGLYFEIIKYNNKYYLFYNDDIKHVIKLLISDSLDFNSCEPKIVLSNVPGGVFTIIKKDDMLYMLCGAHISNKEKNEKKIPNLVWSKKLKTILDWTVEREDRKNGMYLLYSTDGIDWKSKYNLPVLHSYIESPTCKLGEIAFDTHPNVIKWKEEYIFFGRLNSSLDERRIYIRKSKDLLNWSIPEKINIINEKTDFNNNYYSFVVFEKNDTLYALAPYFQACGTVNRKTINGEQTLYLKSINGIDWEIIDSYLHTPERYQLKINSVLIENNKTILFYRENCLSKNQNLFSCDFDPHMKNKIIIKNDTNVLLKKIVNVNINDNIIKATIKNDNKDGTVWIVLESGEEIKDFQKKNILI